MFTDVKTGATSEAPIDACYIDGPVFQHTDRPASRRKASPTARSTTSSTKRRYDFRAMRRQLDAERDARHATLAEMRRTLDAKVARRGPIVPATAPRRRSLDAVADTLRTAPELAQSFAESEPFRAELLLDLLAQPAVRAEFGHGAEGARRLEAYLQDVARGSAQSARRRR